MGSHKHHSITSSYTPTPTPPVADYNVAVNPELVPDCSGNYFIMSTYNEKPCYRRADGEFFLYFLTSSNSWWISKILGYEGGTAWEGQQAEQIEGIYLAEEGFEGNATVAAGPQ